MPTKLQRHLDLIAYLVGRRLPVPVEELMEKIPAYTEGAKTEDSARRMFERDKDELRRIGIPLRTTVYTVDGQEVEGYEIRRRDFYLPYLKLISERQSQRPRHADRHRVDEVEIQEADAPLALEALRLVASIPSFPFVAEAQSAFRKLAFDLEPDVFAGHSPPLFVEKPGGRELGAQLRVLSDALLARKRVRFRYRGIYRDEQTNRVVLAYGLLFQHGNWYLIGHDEDRNDIRVFRADRMEQVKVNTAAPNAPDYEVPRDFRLKDFAGRRAWELGDGEEPAVMAHVRFDFPQSLWAERNNFGQLVSHEDDGASVRLFHLHQVNPFLRWVLSLEGDAQIISPTEMSDQLRALARGIADAHRGGDDAGG